MKKKIIAVLITMILLVPTTVYAKNTNNNGKGNDNMNTTTEQDKEKGSPNSNDNTEKKNQNKARVSENKADQEQFKASLKAKHKIMKENISKTNTLKKEISLEKQELAKILEEIKAGSKTLNSDDFNLLITKSASLRESVSTIQNLPEINSDVKSAGNDIKTGKYETALVSLDKVIAKQEDRYSKLLSLKNSLDDLLAIAKQAVPVTTNSSTDSTDSIDSEETDNNIELAQ